MSNKANISIILGCAAALGACRAGARVGPVHAGGGVDPNEQVSDINRSVDFYTQLGFRVDRQTDQSAKLTRDGVELNLRRSDNARAENQKQEHPLIVQVDNLQRATEKLQRAGVTSQSIERGRDGLRATIDDPDGNPIVLEQKTPSEAH